MFELLKKGLLKKRTLLILNYAKLDISENQLAILLLIMELSDEDQKNFTPSQLAKYMSIDKEVIDKEISKLLVNNLIKLESKGKKTVLNFTPLFSKLIVILEEENSKLNTDNSYVFIEDMIGIKLSSENIEEIDSFIEKGLSKPKIMSIINENNIKTYAELKKVLDKFLKTNAIQITRFNWLND
ncbi:putative dnad-like replication protein [Spiroplasma chinense]|uniref:Putative dnad-like replication protein n=1 Tax=Spiroplasma chinense TaxID=216932 RepID=A0A5B9Y4K8_9MOLU|nr:DnaD family protein [Spiroplasma chinense]QEH61619.1 putative dnad-like replication protein [Spiroplasma chinense]